jgi:hypothetical protein
MANDTPPDPRGRGSNILMLLILLIVLAGALVWGFLRNPPDAPDPTKTGSPAGIPAS